MFWTPAVLVFWDRMERYVLKLTIWLISLFSLTLYVLENIQPKSDMGEDIDESAQNSTADSGSESSDEEVETKVISQQSFFFICELDGLIYLHTLSPVTA